MINGTEHLINEIEQLRSQLNRLAVSKNVLDPDVVKASQELDVLLNRYETHKRTVLFLTA